MTHIVDTSLLIRQTDSRSVDQQTALHATRALLIGGEDLKWFSQNMIKFWAVATRPFSANGLALSTADAETQRQRLEVVYPVLPDPPGIYTRWVQLVNQYGVSGKPTHGARIVTAMLEHGITHILTFNVRDFLRYAPLGIVAVDPATV